MSRRHGRSCIVWLLLGAISTITADAAWGQQSVVIPAGVPKTAVRPVTAELIYPGGVPVPNIKSGPFGPEMPSGAVQSLMPQPLPSGAARVVVPGSPSDPGLPIVPPDAIKIIVAPEG